MCNPTKHHRWQKPCLLVGALVGVLVAVVLPIVVERKLQAGVTATIVIDSTESHGYADWADSTRPNAAHQIVRFHMFNITNPDAVLQGVKPSLVELPPMDYLMVQEAFNVSFSEDKTIMSYQLYQRFLPQPGTDVLARQNITSINMPFQGLVGRHLELVQEFIKRYNTPSDMMFVNRPINDILFGYLDHVLQDLAPLDPGLNPVYRGLQFNASSLEYADKNCSTIRMYTGVKHRELLRETISWDDMASMNCCNFGSCGPVNRGGARGASWQHAPANDIRGTMGHQFRSGLRAGDSIPLFVPSIYRAIDLQNVNGEEVYVRKIKALRFRIPSSTFLNKTSLPANAAYWADGPDGLLNISACESKASVLMSKPHFLQGDPALVTALVGLSPPDPALHDTTLDVEPITGATVQLAARLQINTLIRPVHDGIHPEPLFPNVTSTYVPLLWFERLAAASEENSNQIVKSVYLARKLETVFLVLGILGAVGCVLGFVYVSHKAKGARRKEETEMLMKDPAGLDYGT